MRLPVQAAAIKALLNFWDPSYRCFTFGNVDMTPTLEEYERILDFPNNSHKIYLRQRFEDTASEVIFIPAFIVGRVFHSGPWPLVYAIEPSIDQ
jgi:hypothetical protein